MVVRTNVATGVSETISRTATLVSDCTWRDTGFPDPKTLPDGNGGFNPIGTTNFQFGLDTQGCKWYAQGGSKLWHKYTGPTEVGSYQADNANPQEFYGDYYTYSNVIVF